MKSTIFIFLLLSQFNLFAQFTSLSSGAVSKLEAVWMFDSATALVAGKDGTMRRTTDAGMSWTSPVTGFADDINDFDFLDASSGYAAADDGFLLRTDDGGMNWIADWTGTGSELNTVDFRNASSGVVATEDGDIRSTVDGGSTWLTIHSQFGAEWQQIVYHSDNVIIAVGKLGVYARSGDGGSTWSSTGLSSSQDLNGVAFLNADTGIIVGDGVAFESYDQGSSWVAVGTGAPAELDDVVTTDGFAFGSGELGFVTRRNPDGTWEDIGAPAGAELNALHFSDPCHGFFAGDAGVVTSWYGGSDCSGSTTPVDTGGTDTTGSGTDSTTTAVIELLQELNIFPNPSSGRINVDYPGIAELELWDQHGRSLWQGRKVSGIQSFHINVPAGIYLLVLTDPESGRRSSRLLSFSSDY